MIDVGGRRFDEMVDEAFDGLPEGILRLMRNVAVVVEDASDDPELLGLYDGIPLTARMSDYAGALPDRITIYRLPICAICETEDDVVEQVRITVVHEIGHHFGIEDERLHELGW